METFRGVAQPWHCDSMGHVTTRFYTGWFDDASYHLMAAVGGGLHDLKSKHLGWADVRNVTEYKSELRSGDLFLIKSTFSRMGSKSLTSLHEMYRTDGVLISTQEMTTVQFDLEKRVGVPIEGAIRLAVENVLGGKE